MNKILLAMMQKCLCFVMVFLFDLALSQQADILLEESAIVTEAVGPAGGIARLPCDVTPAATSDRLALVIWYKQGHEAPIYSYDSRHEVSHWSDPGTLGSRASFQVDAQPAVLILDHLRAEDSGQYRCRVDFIVSPTKNSRINLTVLIPPDKLLVLNDAGTELSKGVLGPYNEGTSVNVTCVAVGGRPTAKVSWWKSHALLASSEARSTINLQITRQDLGQEISCQAVTDPSMPPKTKVLEVDVNLKPLWVRLQGARRPLIAGQLTELICQVVGARPKPSISWWKGGTRLKGFRETTSSDGNMTTSVLSIVPVLSDAGRVISCRAVQPSLSDSIKEDGWKLEIQHTPVVNLELGSNLDAGNIVEGSDVYLDCRIKANPWHHHVYFTHNGIPVRPGPGVIVANQSLVLQGVSRPKAGIYICAARNQLGEGTSNELILNVKFAPKCRSDRATVIRAARGEVVTISCLLDANPIDTVTYRWWFNSSSHTKMLLNQKGSYATDHTGAELQYNISGSSDYGWIQCAGKNSVGDQIEPCNYQILPADKPSPLTSCEVLNVTLSTLSLTCIAGHDGGTKQRFLLQAYDMSTGFLLRNMSSDSPNFTVEGLPGGAALSVSVRAFNRQGSSDAATVTTNTLKPPERHLAGGSPIVVQLTPLLACVAGVAASLVALSVCVVAIIRCSHKSAERRNNRNDSSDENNKSRQDDSTKMPLNASTNADSVDSLEKNPDIIPLNGNFGEDSSHITSGGDYGTIRPLIPSRRLEPDYSMNKTPSFVYEKLKIDTKGYRDRNDQYIQLRPLDSRLPHVVNHNMYGPQYVGSMINDNLAVKYHTGTLDRRFNERSNVGSAYPEYILSPDSMVPNPGLYINHNAVRPLYRDDQKQQMMNEGASLYSKNLLQNQSDSVFHLENRLHPMPSVIDRRPGSGDGSLTGMDPCVSQAPLQLPTFSFTTEANNFSGNSSENCPRQQPVIQETKT